MCSQQPKTPMTDDEDSDDHCDLDPSKICDNCMKCVTDGADYRAIVIDSIQLEHEFQRVKH